MCLLDRLERTRLCDRSEISASVAAFIGRKALKAKAHAARTIGASPKRYRVQVRRTLALLGQLARKVDAATASGKLTGVCRDGVASALARTVSLAESTTF
jgi:hypothetical protein